MRNFREMALEYFHRLESVNFWRDDVMMMHWNIWNKEITYQVRYKHAKLIFL